MYTIILLQKETKCLSKQHLQTSSLLSLYNCINLHPQIKDRLKTISDPTFPHNNIS